MFRMHKTGALSFLSGMILIVSLLVQQTSQAYTSGRGGASNFEDTRRRILELQKRGHIGEYVTLTHIDDCKPGRLNDCMAMAVDGARDKAKKKGIGQFVDRLERAGIGTSEFRFKLQKTLSAELEDQPSIKEYVVKGGKAVKIYLQSQVIISVPENMISDIMAETEPQTVVAEKKPDQPVAPPEPTVKKARPEPQPAKKADIPEKKREPVQKKAPVLASKKVESGDQPIVPVKKPDLSPEKNKVSIVEKRLTVEKKAVVPAEKAAPSGSVPAVSPPEKGQKASCPEDMVRIGTFCIDRTEVSIGEYRRVFPDYAPPGNRYTSSMPVVNISHEQAIEFARKTGRRLCTDREWITALGSNVKLENAILEFGGPGDVPFDVTDLSDKNEYGVLNMTGNVSEWVSTQNGRPAHIGGHWYFYIEGDVTETAVRELCFVDAPDVKKLNIGVRRCMDCF